MQEKQGHRQTLSLSNTRKDAKPKFDYGNKKPSGAQRILAHDRDIKNLKESKHRVNITLVSGGSISGIIVDSDKYTIKMLTSKRPNSHIDFPPSPSEKRTFFKHAIESFAIEALAAEIQAD